jgi:hypothetical protein
MTFPMLEESGPLVRKSISVAGQRQSPIAVERVEKQLERPMRELKLSQMNARVRVSEAEDFSGVFPDQSIFGLRSSCDRAEFKLAFVIRLAPI